MALIVQKYGGTSVGTVEKIKAVATKVIDSYKKGDRMVVVLSAMAGKTDGLIKLARQVASEPDPREMDVLLATGEQESVALFSMAVKDMGFEAQSMLGFQIAIHTDHIFGRAKINQVETDRILKALDEKKIVAIAGFQGLDEKGDITTLGRGGSDTTAVAIAAAVKADRCEIFKDDVEGIYTTNPDVCPKAKKMDTISYEEMLEMASLGAKVLEIRAVEFAMKYNVPVYVRSTFSDKRGTMVVAETKDMEKVLVSGVAYSKNESRVTIRKVPDRPGIASGIFQPVFESGIVVDMIVQNTSEDGSTDITFTVPKPDFYRTMKLVSQVAQDIGAEKVLGDEDIAKVSIVGVGMRTHAGVANRMFAALAAENINIMMISTSEIKISVVIEAKYLELAVRTLHKTFGLDDETKGE
ncbi:MAG: aspartate kinase [Deltaproteobacteria bacterium CG_4_8_14_3_um_filter_51_11]|nr:aspartate kinase [bacterium]OIP38230.1 MAG: aspartate kinase [Desulfobacteraceae bacterium CG2_30_51_40]PIP46753.1 MAG: aspartate kinase [Deltaproteobacteria bacterium CG23_combo_of_CG06-09_8_20_14_all_51_20]PIX19562.1 MAG: aspartate kinase [Deltaproteobacteria bacterium CG_4_8_14_3_um_filter_51_11]PIY22196.1 MAG: aspartate kinase [Deltaproteobacteria bacterium CG_4_10_14_3_um_filter_51_14]PJB37893.1 MAG: aspartate kinase [Deltaproteobacteria bacterium CG_4_9_14_3_um_filter_51_14]